MAAFAIGVARIATSTSRRDRETPFAAPAVLLVVQRWLYMTRRRKTGERDRVVVRGAHDDPQTGFKVVGRRVDFVHDLGQAGCVLGRTYCDPLGTMHPLLALRARIVRPGLEQNLVQHIR